MSLVAVKIKGLVITGPYGTLTDGTILRTSEAFAAHLVNECNAADYVAKTEKAPEEKPVRKGK